MLCYAKSFLAAKISPLGQSIASRGSISSAGNSSRFTACSGLWGVHSKPGGPLSALNPVTVSGTAPGGWFCHGYFGDRDFGAAVFQYLHRYQCALGAGALRCFGAFFERIFAHPDLFGDSRVSPIGRHYFGHFCRWQIPLATLVRPTSIGICFVCWRS